MYCTYFILVWSMALAVLYISCKEKLLALGAHANKRRWSSLFYTQISGSCSTNTANGVIRLFSASLRQRIMP